MYYQAVYISDSDHKLVFQHFLNSSAPTYDKLWPRISSMCPWMVDPDDVDSVQTSGNEDREGTLSGNLGKDYQVFKYKVKSYSSTLQYWALCSRNTAHNVSLGEPFFVLGQFHNTLLEYFDKNSLSVSKITNNADRVSIICNYLLDGGYYNTSGMYDSRMKQIIPERSDLSKIITNTAHQIQTAVQKGPSSSPGAHSFRSGETDSKVVPWRSGKNPHNERNELYVDVVENVHLIYKKNKYVTGHVNGTIHARCYLRGNPLVEINFQTPLGVPAVHECVDKRTLLEQEEIKSIKFIPPEGRFILLKYCNTNSTPPTAMVSASIEEPLGPQRDEFQITLNIKSSTTIKHIEDLVVTINLDSDQHFKVKPLQITHGRMESTSKRWIFDHEMPTGTLPVLRGCIERTEYDNNNNDEGNGSDNGNDSSANPVARVHSVSITYNHIGSSATTHSPVQSITVDAPATENKNLFKGVKYHTVMSDYEIRT